MSKPKWRDVLTSVIFAIIGVQSTHAHQRDFQATSPWRFILVGLTIAILLTVGLIFAVKVLITYLGGSV